jgi:fatty acid desaturase
MRAFPPRGPRVGSGIVPWPSPSADPPAMSMKLFRHREDVPPVLCIVSLTLLDLAVFFLAPAGWLPVAWLLLVLGPKACICSWNHHHQHLLTFHQPVLNRLLELCYAFHTGITTNAWVLHHVLGHHVNYLDQAKDESAWKRRDGTTMGELEYTLVIAITGYLRAFRVARRYPRYRAGFFGMGLLVVLLLAAAFVWNPFNALVVFAIPMAAGYLVTCWHTYCHHAGLDTQNPYEASHNILHRSYNILTGNLGYHTAHHVKPKLHWSKLPAFHATIADRIPEHLYIEPFFPMSLLPAGPRPKSL